MLARMFEKRLRGYTAMGYRRRAPDEVDRAANDYVVEYDEEALRVADGELF
jgi:hypothetical protein